jgi:hypothetical protein
VIGGLVLLYLIRPRRRQVEGPFGGLWRWGDGNGGGSETSVGRASIQGWCMHVS